MKLGQLQHRIARAEAVLEGRGQQLVQQWQTGRQVWRAAWTPGRIVLGGLGLGVVAGLSAPTAALGSLAGKVGALPKLLQTISAVAALFTASGLQEAAGPSEPGTDGSEHENRVAPTPSDRPVPAAELNAVAPGPAEAATDVSERHTD